MRRSGILFALLLSACRLWAGYETSGGDAGARDAPAGDLRPTDATRADQALDARQDVRANTQDAARDDGLVDAVLPTDLLRVDCQPGVTCSCPQGQQCRLQCPAKGCLVDCLLATSCIIDCPAGGCDGTIDCGELCAVSCGGTNSCGGTIRGSGTLAVSCTGESSCSGGLGNITGGTGLLHIACIGKQSCSGKVFKSGSGPANIYCKGAQSCGGSLIDFGAACAGLISCDAISSCPAASVETCPAGCPASSCIGTSTCDLCQP